MNWKQLASEAGKVVVAYTVTAILGVVVAALHKHEARLLTSASGIWSTLTGTPVPLWLFLAVCVVAIFGWLRVYQKRRKPILHIVWEPHTLRWHLGAVADRPAMQVSGTALFSHTEQGVNLVLTQAYFEGTRCTVGFFLPIMVNHGVSSRGQVMCFVEPVKAKEGHAYKGVMIFVDQLNRHHKAPKATFIYT